MLAYSLPNSSRAPATRRDERFELLMYATLRELGATRFRITLRDLSTHGFRCETSALLALGSYVFLTIPGLSPLDAKIKWREGAQYGGRFIHPLHPAVLDHIVSHAQD